MSIRSRTASLDDASGDLALSLAKLELEAAHGTPNADEQIDFVRDLSRVAVQKRIHPWRVRSLQAVVLGAACVGAFFALPTLQPRAPKEVAPGLLALGAAFFVAAVASLAVALRRGQLERRWLKAMEAAVRAGRTILDEP